MYTLRILVQEVEYTMLEISRDKHPKYPGPGGEYTVLGISRDTHPKYPWPGGRVNSAKNIMGHTP